MQQDCELKVGLRDLLLKSSKGKMILGNCNSNNKLMDSMGDKLAELLIENEIAQDVDKR